VSELCEQPDKVTLSSDESYQLAYPTRQEFELQFPEIIDSEYDRSANSWFRTCYPNVSLEVPVGTVGKFSILDFDETSATISVEGVPSAKIYIARYTLMGQNT